MAQIFWYTPRAVTARCAGNSLPNSDRGAVFIGIGARLTDRGGKIDMGPLAGIKVVEIAGIGPGPCAGMMLADMGAEVILVERRNPNANAADIVGDDSRQAFFNRGKKSIALDLKHPHAIELVLRLVAEAQLRGAGAV